MLGKVLNVLLLDKVENDLDRISRIDPQLRAYRARLLARPSFARAVDGGRPYRHYFPLGAPDRD